MKLLKICLALMITTTAIAKESPRWESHGFGPYYHKDEADGISIDSKGNTFIAGGFTNTFYLNDKVLKSKGKRDIFYAKYAPSGKLVWVKTIATSLDENIYDLTIDPSDNLILNGEQQIASGGKKKYAAVTYKLNSRGKLLWKKTFTSDQAAGGNEITTDQNGNIYSTYISQGSFSFDGKKVRTGERKNSHILKLSPNGRVMWAVHTSGRGPERTRAITTAYSGSRIVVGFEYKGEIAVNGKVFKGPDKKSKQGAFMILDKHGKVKKFEAITGSRSSNVRGAAGYNDGIYLYGTINGDSKLNGQSILSVGSRDSFLQKIDKNGNNIWVRVLGNKQTEDGGEVVADKKGNVYITGEYRGEDYAIYSTKQNKQVLFLNTSNNPNAFLVKLSPYGRPLNSYSASSSRSQSAGGVIETRDGQTSIGVRFKGAYEVNGATYNTIKATDKDFIILNFDF